MTTAALRPALALLASLAFLPAASADEPAKCTYVEVATLPIRYAGSDLVPATDGVIDGSPATMLIDTGSDQTFLTRTAVEKRDLSLHMTGRYVEGVSGLSRIYATRLKEFAVGPARSARRLELQVVGQTTYTPSYDAIVGAEFLFQADLELSLRDKELKFFRPQDCGQAWLGYWKEDSIAVPFESSFSRSRNPHFTVMLNGKKLDAMIDSGAQHTVVMLGAAKRAGIEPGGAGTTRLADMAGVGTDRAPHWSAVYDTLAIGTETIRGGEIGVVDSQGSSPADIYLGQDFLRAHRVLFAMSQQKLYLAYLGGDVFRQRKGIEPWMQAEADAGNPDAQYLLAEMYQRGRGVAQDKVQAAMWLEKAAALGQPQAGLLVGRRLMLVGLPIEGAARIKAALDKLPAERYGALWLHVARLRNGEPDSARRELEATFKRGDSDDWPGPIAEFYLGRIDAARLLAQAGKDQRAAKARSCQANTYMAELRGAQGDKEQAASLVATVRANCGPPPASTAR
ncbi:MAG: retroviral-like aspartic protease family protein [Massilia sp.]